MCGGIPENPIEYVEDILNSVGVDTLEEIPFGTSNYEQSLPFFSSIFSSSSFKPRFPTTETVNDNVYMHTLEREDECTPFAIQVRNLKEVETNNPEIELPEYQVRISFDEFGEDSMILVYGEDNSLIKLRFVQQDTYRTNIIFENSEDGWGLTISKYDPVEGLGDLFPLINKLQCNDNNCIYLEESIRPSSTSPGRLEGAYDSSDRNPSQLKLNFLNWFQGIISKLPVSVEHSVKNSVCTDIDSSNFSLEQFSGLSFEETREEILNIVKKSGCTESLHH